MWKRSLLLVLYAMLIVSVVCADAVGEMMPLKVTEQYDIQLRALDNYLTMNQEDGKEKPEIQEIYRAFSDNRNIGEFAAEFKLYVEVLYLLEEHNYEQAAEQCENLLTNSSFEYFREYLVDGGELRKQGLKAIGTVEELMEYVYGRWCEAVVEIGWAVEYYSGCESFYDSSDRINRIVATILSDTNGGNEDIQVYSFVDQGVEAAVKDCLGKFEESITLRDLETIEELYAGGYEIQDISDLKNMPNLELLELWGNKISDISPLNGLQHLRILDLSGNMIEDLSPLQNMKQLFELGLGCNSIRDIKPLEKLIYLKTLTLDENYIVDLWPLRDMIHLEHLGLSSNKITDISSLGNFYNLEYLDLSMNKIVSIESLDGLTSLETLLLYDNDICDISATESMISLKGLSLNNNVVSDISPVSGLNHLIWFYIDNNCVEGISPIAELRELYEFSASDNKISDISPALNMDALSILHISGNCSPMKSAEAKDLLEAKGCQVNDYEIVYS